MPSGPRIRGNNSFGVTTDDPLTAVAATFNSAQLSTLPAVSSAHAIITLDPLRKNGEPEIIVVTAHGAGATSATITRAAYGTAARSHPVGTTWVHAPVIEDVIPILTSGTRPSDPYRGESIFETDTNRFVARSTADVWQQNGLFFDPPACRVFNSANISITTSGVSQTLTYDSERYDTDSMHSTSVNTGRITFNTAGIYTVTSQIIFFNNSVGERYIAIVLNGTTTIVRNQFAANGTGGPWRMQASTTYKFSVSDYIETSVFQTSGGALNINFEGNDSPEFMATWIGRGN